LNELIGRSVYTSQDQLGCPQVTVPYEVTQEFVQSDQEGRGAIPDWTA
jgi:acetyl-CoA carboxylase/biotin carboxylase 1